MVYNKHRYRDVTKGGAKGRHSRLSLGTSAHLQRASFVVLFALCQDARLLSNALRVPKTRCSLGV